MAGKNGGARPGAGRPKGSITRPQLRDFYTPDEIADFIKDLKETAKANAEAVLFDVANSLMTNPRLVQDFGQPFTKTKMQNEMTLQRISKFTTRNGIMVEARSTIAQPPGNVMEKQQVAETRRKLTENQSR